MVQSSCSSRWRGSCWLYVVALLFACQTPERRFARDWMDAGGETAVGTSASGAESSDEADGGSNSDTVGTMGEGSGGNEGTGPSDQGAVTGGFGANESDDKK